MNTLAVAFRNNLAPGNDWLLGGRPAGNRRERRAREAQGRRGETRRTVAEARRFAHEIGTSVWSATDMDDLVDLLDANLDDPTMAESAVNVSGALFRSEFDELPDFPSFARAINAKTADSVLPDLLAGMRVISIISGLFRKGRSQAASRPVNSAADTWADLDFYSLPVPMLESALAGVRSLICLASLVDLGVSDRPAPHAWLVKEVVRGWVDGNRSFLRTLAMHYGDEDVPEDLLPKAQRLDQERMIQEHNQGEIIFEQFIAGAIAAQ